MRKLKCLISEQGQTKKLQMRHKTKAAWRTGRRTPCTDTNRKSNSHTEMGGIVSVFGAVQADIQNCGGRTDEAEKRVSNEILRTQYNEMTSEKATANLLRLKQEFYDQGETPGKLLAWCIKQQ